MVAWQPRRLGQYRRIRQPAGKDGFEFALARCIRRRQFRQQRLKISGRHFALTHQQSDLALVGRKALTDHGAERLGFPVHAAGLKCLDPGGIGFDG